MENGMKTGTDMENLTMFLRGLAPMERRFYRELALWGCVADPGCLFLRRIAGEDVPEEDGDDGAREDNLPDVTPAMVALASPLEQQTLVLPYIVKFAQENDLLTRFPAKDGEKKLLSRVSRYVELRARTLEDAYIYSRNRSHSLQRSLARRAEAPPRQPAPVARPKRTRGYSETEIRDRLTMRPGI